MSRFTRGLIDQVVVYFAFGTIVGLLILAIIRSLS